MEWFERHLKQVEHVFQMAKFRIAEFPSPLNEIGLQYAEKFNPVANDGGKDYICVLLPFWMQETTHITDEQCKRLALANVYGMLYFFIQDDVMDSSQPERWKPQLALANLLHLEMIGVLRQLFPSESLFWDYYDRYVTTWADCVMNEDKANYFVNNPLRMAGKAGPVKISSTGACLLSGLEEQIQSTEMAVDYALMTLQMLDDWADWREDLAECSYNGLLAMIASEVGVSIEALTVDKIESHIYVLGSMNRYADVAIQNHERLLNLSNPATSIVDFHAYMVDSLKDTALRLETNKRKMLGGGINLFL